MVLFNCIVLYCEVLLIYRHFLFNFCYVCFSLCSTVYLCLLCLCVSISCRAYTVCSFFLHYQQAMQRAIHTSANNPALCVCKCLYKHSTELYKASAEKQPRWKASFFFFTHKEKRYGWVKNTLCHTHTHTHTQRSTKNHIDTQNLNSWSVNALFSCCWWEQGD